MWLSILVVEAFGLEVLSAECLVEHGKKVNTVTSFRDVNKFY